MPRLTDISRRQAHLDLARVLVLNFFAQETGEENMATTAAPLDRGHLKGA